VGIEGSRGEVRVSDHVIANDRDGTCTNGHHTRTENHTSDRNVCVSHGSICPSAFESLHACVDWRGVRIYGRSVDHSRLTLVLRLEKFLGLLGSRVVVSKQPCHVAEWKALAPARLYNLVMGSGVGNARMGEIEFRF